MTRVELPFPVPLSACSVDGCEGKRANRGRYCWGHYNRLRKHGDLMVDTPIRKRAANGEPLQFFQEQVLTFTGEDCLVWPYTSTERGYGTVWFEGKFRVVSRLVCERLLGPPPTRKHEAAHSCGNGHKGCVNPSHLSWKTPSENQADKILHGTTNRGEAHPSAKLKQSDVDEIRAQKGSSSHRELAEMFNVSMNHIGRIQRGERWSD